MTNDIDVSVKMYCLNEACFNQVPGCNFCNLKRVVIDTSAKCGGFVKGPNERKTKKRTKTNKG